MTAVLPGPLRRDPLANWRDLGGIAVAEARVRPGRLSRSDDVSFVDSAGARAIIDAGITLVLDLRSEHEARLSGPGPLREFDVEHLHLPLGDAPALPGAAMARELLRTRTTDDGAAESLGRWYAALIEEHSDTMLAGLTVISTTSGATLFHCIAGKDRAGIFAACLLTALGAGPDAVRADYVRTNETLPQVLARIRELVDRIHGNQRHALAADTVLLSAPQAAVVAMFEDLQQRRGGLLQVLRDAGLDQQLIDTLRDRCVEP